MYQINPYENKNWNKIQYGTSNQLILKNKPAVYQPINKNAQSLMQSAKFKYRFVRLIFLCRQHKHLQVEY